MTTVLGRIGSGQARSRRDPVDGRLPSPVRVRRPALAVASVGLVVVSIAAFVGVYARAQRQTEVVTVVRPVAQGQLITAADLGESSISSSGGLSTVPASEASGVVGRVAAVSLVPGTALTMAEVGSGPDIRPGDAVVGVALKDGQLPASGVAAGDKVMVIQTATPGTPVGGAASGPSTGSGAGGASGSGSSTGVLDPDATVYDIAPPSSSSASGETQLVSLEVSSTLAPQVSVAAAADQISLVLLPQAGDGS